MQASATTNHPGQLTVAEFADALRRRPFTVRKWAREGMIVSSKTGNVILIPSSEVERLTTPGVTPKRGPKTAENPHARIRRNGQN